MEKYPQKNRVLVLGPDVGAVDAACKELEYEWGIPTLRAEFRYLAPYAYILRLPGWDAEAFFICENTDRPMLLGMVKMLTFLEEEGVL